MSIMWNYLDKKAATIEAIGDYNSMQFIIEHTEGDIKALRNNLTAISSPGMDGMPHAHNPNAGEEKLLDAIDRIDLLKERCRQAMEYMNWFQPAWDALEEDERYILDAFYRSNGYGANAVDAVRGKFSIDRNSAYKKKNRALEHLALLLYGKE